MRFNADRLAALAGVNSGGQSGMLNEASNRSYHDDASLAGERDLQHGKGQLAEADDAEDLETEGQHSGGDEEDPSADVPELPADIMGEVDEDDLDEDMHSAEGAHQEDELVEIDESMLKREIIKMKNQRQKAVAENKVRQAVRREIREMFGTEKKVYSDSSWVYGDNKPTHSKKGRVAMGALGVGFKK